MNVLYSCSRISLFATAFDQLNNSLLTLPVFLSYVLQVFIINAFPCIVNE